MHKKITLKTPNIVIFGGSFNSFHDGHAKLCDYFLSNSNYNKFFILPNNNKFFNMIQQISSEHKINIINLFIKKMYYKNVYISDIELKQKTIAKTFDSIKYFFEKYPDHHIYFLLGDDQLINLHKWDDLSKMLQHSEFIFIKKLKKGALNFEKISAGISRLYTQSIKLENHIFDFSSRELYNGKNLGKFKKELIDYINKNSLFWEYRLNKYLYSKRVLHCQNVAKLAITYGQIYSVDTKRLFFAAIYHDYFKNLMPSHPKWKKFQYKYLKSKKLKKLNPKVLHGHFACSYIEKNWFVNDNDILCSIAHHTLPSLDMSIFEKIIFCADKLSEERENKPYYDEIRVLALSDINKAFSILLFYLLSELIIKKGINDPYFLDLAKKYFLPKDYVALKNLFKLKFESTSLQN